MCAPSYLGPITAAWLWRILTQLRRRTLKPAVPNRNGQPERNSGFHAAGLPNQRAVASCPPQLKLAGESLAELLTALKISAEEMDRAAIDAIQASFREQPAVGLLSAPEEIVTAPAPPAAQWMRPQKPKFTAIRAGAHGTRRP